MGSCQTVQRTFLGGTTAEVLVLGATSMVGSHFVASTSHSVAAAGRTDPRQTGLDIERFDPLDLNQPEAVGRVTHRSPEPVVVDFAARTDVDGVERERPPARSSQVSAWTVNALAADALARGCHAAQKYFVLLSTDFVFDGECGPYDEFAERSPLSDRLSWYGWTKSEGERLSERAEPSCAVVRISLPYRANFPAKLDFARAMIGMQRKGTLPPLYSNQQITPTWIPDVSRTLEVLTRTRARGVFHVASPEITTPLQFGRELIGRIGEDTSRIIAGRLERPAPRSGRAPRPILGGLRSTRHLDLDFPLTPWQVGIEKLVAGDENL